MLTVPHIRAKLHDHIRKLVEVRPRAEILNCFIFEDADFLRGEAMHLDHLQRLPVKFKGELELFKLSEALV